LILVGSQAEWRLYQPMSLDWANFVPVDVVRLSGSAIAWTTPNVEALSNLGSNCLVNVMRRRSMSQGSCHQSALV